MQNGELDAGPKPSEVAATLTFTEKLKNTWYHDKLGIIIVGVLAVIIAAFCVQCATKTNYDATVIVFTHTIAGDPICDKMAEYLEPYCKDVNGDEEINLNVINCSIEGENTSEYSSNSRIKMNSIIANNPKALLFITDESSYKELADFDFFEGKPIKFGDDFYEYCVDESGFYETPENLQISCRTLKGSTIENSKNVDLYYDCAQSILEGLKFHKAENN